MTRILAPALFVVLVGGVAPAAARVVRFAVLIGNDRGRAHESPLRYASSDATRVARVLRDLGGFEPENTVLLNDEPSRVVRNALLSINERIRETISDPDTDALLLVYYSGHADDQALHLGDTSFAVRELAQLVRGSAADFRLVVVDACRSGALTRLKGGRVVAPFELPNERLPGDGLAFLTASSATEDAQESDDLGSSFFTHALVTGLLGAADRDADGAVALDEAYRYAYDATLRSTSRTLAGTQHPTFRYDFRGTGGLTLTRPGAYRAHRAHLLFPESYTFLLMQGGADGPVAAELPSFAPDRGLSVRPGRYFVRARGERVLYEGSVVAHAGASQPIVLAQLKRVPYNVPGRKGSTGTSLRHAVQAGARLRTALPNEGRICPGGYVGYALQHGGFGARIRLGACGSGFDNGYVRAHSVAFEATARLYHVWSLSPLALSVGAGGGLSVIRQRFETTGLAPSRVTAAPLLAMGSVLSWELLDELALDLDISAETHFLPVDNDTSRTATITFALRPGLGISWAF